MIPRIQRRGHSFKGVTAYLMHDKGAETTERVSWTETVNLRTDDIEKAAKIMAWTDMHRDDIRAACGGSAVGAKSKAGNVYHCSLSWAAGESPSAAHQRDIVRDYLEHQGLAGHQYYAVGHSDTGHAHVHIVVNLVQHETGKIHELSFDKRKAQSWALAYEKEHGLHCQLREDNAAKAKEGQPSKYRTKKQDYAPAVTRAYRAADNGKAFVHALKKEGLTLCAARRGAGFVIVDKKGDIQKLARQLELDEKGKAKTAAINTKLADIDRSSLPDADRLAAQCRAALSQEPQKKDVKAGRPDEDKTAAKAPEQDRQQQALLARATEQRRERLQVDQKRERYRLERRLRAARPDKEAPIRKRWGVHIIENKQIAATLKAKLSARGLRGFLYRARHGKQAREDIKNAQKSRRNAQNRQAEEISVLDKSDRAQFAKLDQRHKTARQALEQELTTGFAPGRESSTDEQSRSALSKEFMERVKQRAHKAQERDARNRDLNPGRTR
jgi:hypothetical protein